MVTGMLRIFALVSRKYLSADRSRSAAIWRIARELGPWSDTAAVDSETSSIFNSRPNALRCSQRSVGSADVMRNVCSLRIAVVRQLVGAGDDVAGPTPPGLTFRQRTRAGMKRRRAQAHGAVAVSARVSMFGREISLRGAFRANCAAMRLHLVEIHDLPSCPPSLRDALTDFLAFSENLAGAYDPVAPLLRRALERPEAARIVALCSGAGGPWRRLASRVGVPVLLTDLYPHHEEVTRVDARAVPAELDGFRTIFTAFHHFRPAEARSILADAVQRGQGIGVFEIARRAALEITVVAFTWLGTLVSAPFIRPWRWSRLAWTYLPPALPIVGTFDGIVSCLRTYSRPELEELVRGLDGYGWDIGDFRGGWSPLRGSYLIGVPRLS